jgi:cytochrome P450
MYGSKANVKKSNFYDAWPRHKDDHHTLNTTDPKLHAKKKQLLNLAFTEKSTQTASIVMAEHIDRWLEIMVESKESSNWSDPRDMAQWADWLALDIMGDLVFGKSFDAKEPTPITNPFKEVPHHVVKFMKIAYPVSPPQGQSKMVI